MSDLLNMEKINNLQHPISCRLLADKSDSLVETICVQTGLMRIDVWGQIDRRHFGEVMELVDANGNRYDADDFYLEDDVSDE